MTDRHSAHHLGRHRDFWWNADFLSLLSQRWGRVFTSGRLLDVGCGQGTWSKTLVPHLPGITEVIGIDAEPAWVAQAARTAPPPEYGCRYRYLACDAIALPFPDKHFDVVTGQTVLIHVADPGAVLDEMLRVLVPGGLIVLVEPSNRSMQVIQDSLHGDEEPDCTAERFEFYLRCERGKLVLREGDNSLGDRLPELLADKPVTGIQLCVSDRAFGLWPPYAGEQQATWRTQVEKWADEGIWIWPQERSQRYFLAGGGSPDDFQWRWARRTQELRDLSAALRAGRYCAGGGRLMYVASAVKADG
jgi:SAM-dependent methyltransferase